MELESNLWTGGQISLRTGCVVADNPSPMTFTGTNTWIISEPGCSVCAVVDPGPESPAHLENIRAACEGIGCTVGAILITHEHLDHDESAPHLSRITGAAIYSRNEGNLSDGRFAVPGGGPVVHIMSLPGHSGDSVGIGVPADAVMLTGDMIFLQSPTVICAPDGVLADYLDSLYRLQRAVVECGIERLLPGHGPVIDDPISQIDFAVAHRGKRLAQIRRVLAEGVAADLDSIVAAVYADINPDLRSAAQLNVQSQLRYLIDSGDPCLSGIAEDSG